jgi:hypothetical protein
MVQGWLAESNNDLRSWLVMLILLAARYTLQNGFWRTIASRAQISSWRPARWSQTMFSCTAPGELQDIGLFLVLVAFDVVQGDGNWQGLGSDEYGCF